MTELNPVERAIRDHVAATYPAWERSQRDEPVATRAGRRYRPHETARLLAPVLKSVGLHVVDDGRTRTFVRPDGTEIKTARLAELITNALADHRDDALRACASSAAFWEYLAGRVPEYAGEIQRTRPTPREPAQKTSTDYSREFRARRRESEAASARAFLEAMRPTLEGQVFAADLHADAIRYAVERLGEVIPSNDAYFWTAPKQRLFYGVCDEFFGERLRRSRGIAYRVAKAVRSAWRTRPLKPRTEVALREFARRVRGAATEEPAPERRRLAWRDRPLSATADAALRGVAAAVLADEEGSA